MHPFTIIETLRPIFNCSTGKGIRTLTPLRATGFEPVAYTIPPPRQGGCGICQARINHLTILSPTILAPVEAKLLWLLVNLSL